MAGNSDLQLVNDTGALRGFGNLMRAETGSWWRTRKWWTQAIIWLLLVNGILAMTIWTTPSAQRDAMENIELYTIFSGIFVAIGVTIMMQGVLVGEKAEGTAAWVLSKPVSRSAFVLSKLFGNLQGVLIILVLLQGAVAFAQISASWGELANPPGFLGAMAIVALNLTFYMTLTLMLGAIFPVRGPVIGIPMAFLFFQQMLVGLFPALRFVLPYLLLLPSNDGSTPSIAGALILGEPVTLWTPVVAVVVWSILFTAVAVWRFQREEF